MKKTIAFGLGLGLAGSAFAGLVVTGAGPFNSSGTWGHAENAVFTEQYTGPATIFSQFSFSGDLTEVQRYTYADEAQWSFQNITRWNVFIYFIPSSIQDFTGTISTTHSFRGLFWASTGDSFRFEARESYDDGSGPDAYWSNTNFTFSDASPPIADLGIFQMGDLNINSFGSSINTELALYSATGQLLASNDDAQGGQQSQILANLGAGSYYAVLGPFDSRFYEGVALGGATTGSYNLNVNGVNRTGTLAAYEPMAFSFTVVPEPGTAALFVLTGAALLIRRRFHPVLHRACANGVQNSAEIVRANANARNTKCRSL